MNWKRLTNLLKGILLEDTIVILFMAVAVTILIYLLTSKPNNPCEVESFDWAEAYPDYHCTHNVYTGYSYHPDNQYQGTTVIDSTSKRLWRGSIYQVTTGSQQHHHCLIS